MDDADLFRENGLSSNNTNRGIDYDYDSDSSGTVQNDPDKDFYLERIDLTGTDDDRRPIDLTTGAALHISDGDYVTDDLTDEFIETLFQVNYSSRRGSTVQPHSPRPRYPSVSHEIIDLTSGPAFDNLDEGDYLTDDCFERAFQSQYEPASILPREEQQPPERREIPEACVGVIVYTGGQSVELHDGTFLRITAILEESTGSVFLRGRRLRSTLRLTPDDPETYIPPWRDELVWMVNEIADVPLEIVRRFVPIHFTNFVNRDQPNPDTLGVLFCRVKEAIVSGQFSVEYLSGDEADTAFRCDPKTLREMWRGETRPFGEVDLIKIPPALSQVIDLDSDVSVVDITNKERQNTSLSQRRRYTFGDGFCGAGGVSSGGHKAGLHIKWAFDSSPHAINTYRLNFDTTCEQSTVFDFLTSEEQFLRVDISHGSPPCQTFSPAHTIECDRDDDNSACIFSCANLVKKAKPRVHTMEETCGLYERHKATFDMVIQDFIEIGYSVRWTIFNCVNYGVPQSRKRLIIIASGPGETLPPFPEPTHGLRGSGLKRFATINSVISHIPHWAEDHDVQGAMERGLRGGIKAPFDPYQQAKTITCGGGEHNYHPSGQRGFTNREFACLQTFPLEHKFGPREVRKQIGNAVPPVLSHAIYQEIVKSLQRTDELELEVIEVE